MTNPVSVNVLTGRAHCDVSFRTDLTIEQIEPLWLALEATAHASFFLSWRWVGTWLREAGLTPNLLMARRDGQLLGLALLQPRNGAAFPHLAGRYLTSSGDGDYDSVFAEYNDFLAEPAARAEVALSFKDFLARSEPRMQPGDGWSRLHLPGVSDNMRHLWTDSRFVVKTAISRPAPFIDFTRMREERIDYLTSRSANCRQQIKRSMRLFQAEGPLQLEEASTPDDAQSIFDELIHLHQGSWQARGKPGAFANPFFQRFHRTLLTEAWPSGAIQLFRLRAGPKTVGCLYNFLHDGNAYAYQSGFAHHDDARLKPGLVAHAMAAERYLVAGIHRYLLLAGDSRYKTSLATGADLLHWLVVRRTGLRATTEEWAETVGRRLPKLAH